MAKRQTKKLKSLRAVEHYLKKKGWNATSAIYRHAKAGLLKPTRDGGYTTQAALAYAHNHLRKISEQEKIEIGADGSKVYQRKPKMKTLLILIGLLLLLQPEQTKANELDWLVGCWETPIDSRKIVDERS